jgi:hypothetical protein
MKIKARAVAMRPGLFHTSQSPEALGQARGRCELRRPNCKKALVFSERIE